MELLKHPVSVLLRSSVIFPKPESDPRVRAPGETDVLLAILERQPLESVLAQLCLLLESRITGALVSVLRLSADHRHLENCVGPNLPEDYRTALEQLPVSENAGSCGTAALRREAVYVVDTQRDPLWHAYRALARKYTIASCWSQPIINNEGRLLGTLAVARTMTGGPEAAELEHMASAATLAAVLITFRESENDLRETQARLNWALSSSMAGMWDTNLTTGKVVRSPGFMRRLGFSESVLGPKRENWRQRIHPDDLPLHDRLVNACARGESTHFEIEYRIRDSRDEWRWILDRGQRLPRDPESGHVHMRGFYSDISALKDSQQSLQQSEQRFRDFARTAADIFWEQDAQLRFVWSSDNTEELTGLTLAELYSKRREELVSKQQLRSAHWRKHLAQIAARQPFSNFEYQVDGPGLSRKFLQVSGTPVFDDQGRFQGYRGTARDITALRQRLDKITYDASHDPLTGLLNRREFEKRLALNIADARRDGLQRAVCFLDLDGFKLINDSAGHAAGDSVLSDLAALLRQRTRENDVLGRLGGDEFGLLLRDCPARKAEEICQQLVDAIKTQSIEWQDRKFHIGMSVGVVMVSPDQGPNELLARADTACYAAKEQGRNRVRMFTPESDAG